MIVCVCRRISDRESARPARTSMGFDEIQFESGVATQDGRCESCTRHVVAQCRASRSQPNIKRAIPTWKAVHGSPLNRCFRRRPVEPDSGRQIELVGRSLKVPVRPPKTRRNL